MATAEAFASVIAKGTSSTFPTPPAATTGIDTLSVTDYIKAKS